MKIARTVDWRRLIWLGASVLGLVALALIAAAPYQRGADGLSYYFVDAFDPYARLTGEITGVATFRYAPPIAILSAPFGLLPWPVFSTLWMAAQLACLWYIAGRWALALVLFPPIWLDISFGNINIMLAAMVVAGFRHPGVWAFALLTKVSPAVGIVWFVVRREWRALAQIGGVVAVAAVIQSAVTGPDLWLEWFDSLGWSVAVGAPDNALVQIPVVVRGALAAGLVAYAARTDRKWLVPIGTAVAMPILWPIALAPAAGAIPPIVAAVTTRLEEQLRRRRPAAADRGAIVPNVDDASTRAVPGAEATESAPVAD